MPFKNYHDDDGEPNCCLTNPPNVGAVTNRFSCPLPSGASKCKCTDDSGTTHPGVVCA